MGVYYVGADVHTATTSFHVIDESGEFVQAAVVPTSRDAVVAFVERLHGTVHLTLEEGTQAHWMYGLLRRRVAEVVVCDPRKNKAVVSAKTNDAVDAKTLAELLRGGLLSPVFHEYDGVEQLKELVRSYDALVGDRTRVKNRLKSLFRSQGIACAGKRIYGESERDVWLERAPEGSLRFRAAMLFLQLESLDELVAEAEKTC